MTTETRKQKISGTTLKCGITEKKESVDILIVGGGPAGATAAKYLSKAGFKTLLIQRNLNFKKPCGGGIRLDAFKKFDLEEKIVKNLISSITLVHKEEKIKIDISKNPIAIVDRKEFDSYLRDLAKNKGCEIWEATFLDLKVFKDYIETTILKNQKKIKIRSSYLIAADGVNSKTRKIVNKDRADYKLTHYADIFSKTFTTCEFHFGSKIAGRIYAWAFPHANGANIGTIADKKEYFQNFVKVLDINENIKIKGYKIPNFKNPLFYKSRVFFVGDAAGLVLPFTYEGIYYAMDSGKMVAQILSKKLNPKEYEKRWKREYLKKFQTLSALQKIFLYNDLTIKIMMRLFRNPKIQKEIIKLWLSKRDLDINFKFFLKVFKKVVLTK